MKYIIPRQIEERIKKIVFKDLRNGDPDRDLPHTKAIVFYIKKIIKTLPEETEIDPIVLIIASYAHDWGYLPFFQIGKHLEYVDYMEAKKHHMRIGAELIRRELENSIYKNLTKKQKERIEHLVLVHDNLKRIVSTDEVILMEADTLAGLDTKFIKPTFTPQSNAKYMESVKTKRFPLFRTDYSKNIFEELLQKRIDYYKKGLWIRKN